VISRPRFILTRQKQRNKVWHESLAGSGFHVIDLPLLQFQTLALPNDIISRSFDWILFTSPQSVDVFAASPLQCGSARLGALGAGTSAAMNAHDMNDDLGFNGLDGKELAEYFTRQISAPASVLLPGAAKRMTEPRETLEACGFSVTELPTYETRPIPADRLGMDFLPDDTVLFCSPSAVRAFISAFDSRPDCVAIGETTAAICREHRFPTQVAATPDLDAMVRASGCEPFISSLEKKS